MTADGCAHDVDNRIDRSDLVKVNRLDWNMVNPGFSFTQKFECPDGHFLRRNSDFRLSNDVLDFGERACLVVVYGAVFGMIMAVQVRMTVAVVVNMAVDMVVSVRLLVLMRMGMT